jgi:hypothetical protein
MLGNILLATIVVAWIVLLFLLFLSFPYFDLGDEGKLGRRFNNVAWNIAVYGTDEAFQEELKHWRWRRRWKRKLTDLRRRRIDVAKWWADRKARNLLPV